MFVAGLELDPGRLRGRARAVVVVSLSSIAVPFALGMTLALACPPLFPPTAEPLARALFLGTALSISALPVIARTLFDLGLQRTALAGLVLAAATVDDVVGWSLFAVISRRGAGAAQVAASLALLVALSALALTLGRRLVRRLRPVVRRFVPLVAPRLAVAASLAFLAGAVAVALGLHPVFGAFLAGAVLSQGEHREEVHATCEAVALGVLAPLYFVGIGLRTNLWRDLDVPLAAAIVVCACAGKWGAAVLAGRLVGLARRESLALGSALNARGAMEILLASVALEQGLIEERLYVALVVMAVVTTALSGPLLSRLALRPAADGGVPAAVPSPAS
jgi:Kef-type K+ transport system membrane component KefB